MEYLYAQSGVPFKPASEEDLVSEIDEGCGDTEEGIADSEANCDDATVALPPNSDSEDEVSACANMYLHYNS